jgi:triacylglycerol esterase/lipase EstA (alpha/beta hydrolase family)
MTDAPVIDVHSLAQGLLGTLQARRQSEVNTANRRLVFIAHSHGGLVVKEALVIDCLSDNAGVASHTDGIVFLGTPHAGSSLANLGRIVSMLLQLWGSDADILKPLTPGSKSLSMLQENFARTLRSLKKRRNNQTLNIQNFFEEYPTTIFDLGLGIRLRRLVGANNVSRINILTRL